MFFSFSEVGSLCGSKQRELSFQTSDTGQDFFCNRMDCCHQRKNVIQLERLEHLVLTMFF